MRNIQGENLDKNFLEIRNLSKTFPGVQALKRIDFSIKKGEIHGLIGENGSGKSTLVKIITGVLQPDPGAEIVIDGKSINVLHSIDSIRMGIAAIFQDFSLFENLSVSENIAISKLTERGVNVVNWREIKRSAEATIQKLGIQLDLNALVGSLSVANKQIVAIARAIDSDAKLLIMDEPTSALSHNEVKALFKVMTNLNRNGISILFISHKLDEVLEICDVITVLRDGEIIGTYKKDEVDSSKLISLMTGKKVIRRKGKESKLGELILEVKNLTKRGNFRNISFKLHSGEILGITGLLGSGKTELAKALFGLNIPDSGEIYLEGRKVKITSPGLAKKYGICYVSEERGENLVLNKSVSDNIIVAIVGKILGRLKLIDFKKGEEVAESWIKRLSIKVPYKEVEVSYLSGGNQQRVAIAKWLATNPKILILDNPAVGIDVGAKSEIFDIINDLAESGIGIILISPEVLEVLSNCQRILVMRKGEIVANFESEKVTEREIMEKAIEG